MKSIILNITNKIFSILILLIMFSCSGKKPTNIGVKNGQLRNCPDSPNCVCSQCNPEDKLHYIKPLTYQESLETAYQKLIKTIEADKSTKIITKSFHYIYVEYTSKIFRFVDDVEFYFPKNKKIIHIRSASRLGRSDLGVNRKRIEKLRKKYQT